MIPLKETAYIISATSEPYDFKGNKGISHKIRFLYSGTIYKAQSTPEQVQLFKQYIGKTGELGFIFDSPKETLKLTIDSFEPEN